MKDQQEPQFGLGKSLFFSAVLIAFCLGLGELTVRGWAYYLRDDAERFDLTTGTFVLIPGEHRSGPGIARINSQGFAGRELEAPGLDLWRLAAVGDSCTYGGGYEDLTYPAMLQTLLEDREQPGLRYEVVNAAISGLNSELALRRLETKVLPLAPDVTTIYIGWNDLMKFDPVAQAGSAAWSGVARVLDRFWLVKGLRKLLFFYVRPYVSPPRTGPESRTGAFADFRPTLYEDNLRAMVEAARRANSVPVLITLPTVVRPEMTARDLRDAGVVFPYFPTAYGVGDLLDLLAAYNASIHRVAEERNAPLIDLARSFESVEDPTEYFFDTMHTGTRGKRYIAEVLLAGLEREGLLGPVEVARREAAGAAGP